jgi:hypothetical protein
MTRVEFLRYRALFAGRLPAPRSMNAQRPRLGAYPVVCALALVAVVVTYSNHFGNEFHFDDSHTIQNNLYIRDLRNIPLFFRSPTTFSTLPTNQSYRPLLTATLALDYTIGGGLNPTAFHVTSFVLFVAQLVAMLCLFRLLMDRALPHAWNRWIALFATSWYGLQRGQRGDGQLHHRPLRNSVNARRRARGADVRAGRTGAAVGAVPHSRCGGGVSEGTRGDGCAAVVHVSRAV